MTTPTQTSGDVWRAEINAELLTACIRARRALAVALTANIPKDLGFDVADHAVIKQLDAVIAKASA